MVANGGISFKDVVEGDVLSQDHPGTPHNSPWFISYDLSKTPLSGPVRTPGSRARTSIWVVKFIEGLWMGPYWVVGRVKSTQPTLVSRGGVPI